MEALAKDSETILKGRWEWRLNPWSKTEEPQWEPYSLEHNYLIEKAYYDKKDEADIGDYIVSIKHMIQKKKGYVTKQRPIRRINWKDNVQEIDRSDRYLETELPKTINQIFGSLGDFTSFFSRRNPEILDFTNQFKELEKSDDLHIINQKIIPILISCFEEVLLKPILEQLQDSSLSDIKKKMQLKMKKQIEELICLFKKEISNIEEFYGKILRAYTMDTDLYPILNNSLRNENWVEVDKILPFAFCLCKAFFNSTLQINSVQDIKILESQPLSSIVLYRGTAFDELALSFYNKDKVQNFSWNSVTSTSKEKRIAEDFMYKSADLANKKYPVLFVIEIPLANEFEEEYLKWIDIRQYSVIPKEDEWILAPGSVFELLGVCTDQDKKTTIKIKMRNEIKSLAQRGMMMQGTLQSQMMTEKQAKIMCVEGEELSQALMSLFGNKLIEELEFCFCTFDRKLLSNMFQTIETLQKLKTLRFIACLYENHDEPKVENPKEGERCEVIRLEVIEASDFFQVICSERRGQEYWVSVRELDLDLRSRRNLTDEKLNCAVFQGLHHLSELTSLNINFGNKQEITDNGVNFLVQMLNSLTQLTYLNIIFENCYKITDNGVTFLAQILSSLNRLRYLGFDFGFYGEITDEGIKRFAQGFSSLNQLTHLKLSFSRSDTITDNGMNSLAKGLNSLIQLTHLDLDFKFCEQITNKGVSILMSQGLKDLIRLTSLILDFGLCAHITDQYLSSLSCKWLKYHPSLSLIVQDKRIQNVDTPLQDRSPTARVKLARESFREEKETLYEEVSYLQMAQTGFRSLEHSEEPLTQDLVRLFVSSSKENEEETHGTVLSEIISRIFHLTSLSLNFKEYKDIITDEFVHKLSSQALGNLPQLRSLTLNFAFCRQITDKGVADLALYGLKPLINLVSLKLGLFWCSITDKAVIDLAREGLKHLSQLKSLTLCFPSYGVTDEGLISLAWGGLRYLSQLEALALSPCCEITDKGIDGFFSQGLKFLTQLKFLGIQISDTEITSQGVNNLILQIVKNLPQFIFLDLAFADCLEVSDPTVHNIIKVLNYFGFTKKIESNTLLDWAICKGTVYLHSLYRILKNI